MSQTYDKYAGSYDRAIGPLERRFLGRWRSETLGLLPRDARILEIGAGTGANFALYPPAAQAVSSEISIEMLRIARDKVTTSVLVQADAVNLPFGADSFDAAFATLVFCSVPSPILAFMELSRVIRNGGRIVLLEHVRPPGLLGPIFDVLNIFTVAFMDDHFNRETVRLAENAGLKILEVRKKAAGIVNLIVCEVVK